jgi:hypothetical protein
MTGGLSSRLRSDTVARKSRFPHLHLRLMARHALIWVAVLHVSHAAGGEKQSMGPTPIHLLCYFF